MNKKEYGIWAIMYDHVRLQPKYERLNNIIRHFAARKRAANTSAEEE